MQASPTGSHSGTHRQLASSELLVAPPMSSTAPSVASETCVLMSSRRGMSSRSE